MGHVIRALPYLVLLGGLGWWVTPVASQSPSTLQVIDPSGTIVNRLGVASESAIRMYIVGSNTTLTTTASVSVDSVTVVNVVSVTALSPLPTTASVSVDSVTVVNTVSTTSSGPQSVVFSGTQNVLSYPTGVYSATQVNPFSITFSGTQNVLAYPTGIYSVTALTPLPTTASVSVDSVTVVNTVSTTSVGPASIVFSGAQSTTQAGPFTVVQNTTARTLTGVASTSHVGPELVRVFDGTNTITSIHPCQRLRPQNTTINFSTTNATRILTGSAGNYTFLCNLFLFSTGTVNVGLVEGTGAQCAANVGGLIGGTTSATGPNLVAQTGFVLPFAIATSRTNMDFCVLPSATVQVSGVVLWVLSP